MKKNSRLNVLMITRNFPPLVGGMEKLNFNIYQCFKDFTNLSLLGPKGSEKYVEDIECNTFPPMPIWRYLLVSIFKAISFYFKKPIDIIFCGSGSAILAGYLLSILKASKLVVYLHGLDIVTKSLMYQFFFMPCIKRADKIIVNSRYTQSLAIAAGIDKSKIIILHPGVEIPDFREIHIKRSYFLEKFDLQNKKILLILGRITNRKGIVEFIKNVMPALTNDIENIHLLVVGSEATAALNYSENVTQKIINEINKNNLRDKVTLAGSIDDQLLSAAYFSADVMVFPILDLPGDVEGFGMVALEAAAHGVKTVAFNVGGVSDAIEENQSGFLIESNNYSKMIIVIKNYLNSQNDKPDLKCMRFAEIYRWPEFNKKFEQSIVDLVKD